VQQASRAGPLHDACQRGGFPLYQQVSAPERCAPELTAVEQLGVRLLRLCVLCCPATTSTSHADRAAILTDCSQVCGWVQRAARMLPDDAYLAGLAAHDEL
jgi:hypothetical protein